MNSESLRSLLIETARLRGRDIGTVQPAFSGVGIDTDRGCFSVDVDSDGRTFLITIRTFPFTWATGLVADLGRVVDAAAAWREGMSVDDFEATFEFMDLDEFARPLEAGNPTPLQWSILVSHDLYARQRPVLSRLHADDTLRTLFPVVSMGTVRLRTDPLDTGVNGHILIDQLAEHTYKVTVVGEEAMRVVDSLDELVGYLKSHITSHAAGNRPPDGPTGSKCSGL